jgi:hypothetical protein
LRNFIEKSLESRGYVLPTMPTGTTISERNNKFYFIAVNKKVQRYPGPPKRKAYDVREAKKAAPKRSQDRRD